jgi:hypothetical protein
VIPGLSLPPALEERVWQRFVTWPEPFRTRLRSDGVEELVRRYEEVVESLETQSCSHGEDGARLTGEEWQYCCGISYEYRNDISPRGVLEIPFEVAPDETRELRARVEPLDRRLLALMDVDASTPRWWMERLPRGVIP